MPAKEYPLSIRFEGPGLKADGLPIGELGEALIAIQRLVYKAYLIHNGEEFVHTALTDMERQTYALQIAKRTHGSEYIFLNWLQGALNDPVIQEKLASMLTMLGGAALTYMEKTVREKLKKIRIGKPNHDVDELTLRMYPEIQEIVKHINNPMVEKPKRKPKGPDAEEPKPLPRVDTISIAIAGMKHPIVFDKEVKEHVQKLENSTKYGELQTITGRVDKAQILKSNSIEALIGKKQFWVKMCLNQVEPGKKKTKKALAREEKAKRLLRKVLRHLSNRKRTNEFNFIGRPVYRLGRSLNWYNEFEVEDIKAVSVPPKKRSKKKTAPAVKAAKPKQSTNSKQPAKGQGK